MKMQIIAIADRGVPNKERLHLRALVDTNLSYLVVYETVYTPNAAMVNAGGRRAFWFPSRDVKANDAIVLYSRGGAFSEEKNADGTTTYFYFWGLSETLWHSPASAVVIFDTLDWITSPSGMGTPAAADIPSLGGSSFASIAKALAEAKPPT